MKRSYEERVQLGKQAHKHTGHKPHRIDIGLHKTKRHAVAEIENHLVVEEMLEEFEQEQEDAKTDYWYSDERFQALSEVY
jgi:hypothetical protein